MGRSFLQDSAKGINNARIPVMEKLEGHDFSAPFVASADKDAIFDRPSPQFIDKGFLPESIRVVHYKNDLCPAQH
jgi:hypothetical protein